MSGYASGLQRGGDFAQWAQLTNGVDAEGRSRGTVVSLGQFRLNLGRARARVTDARSRALEHVLPGRRVAAKIASKWRATSSTWSARASYRGVDGTLEARYRPVPRASIVAGVETVYDHEELDNPVRIDRATGAPVPETRTDPEPLGLVDMGAYVNASYQLFDRWLKLNGGVRYDHHSEYGGQLTGRVGATSRWTPSIVAKLLYGTAFKAPSRTSCTPRRSASAT